MKVNAPIALVVVFWAAQVALAQHQAKDALPSAPEGQTWKLAWHDEFEGASLDESKWETPPDAPRKGGWWMRKAVSLDGKGHLVISTLKEGDRYIDGCVRTRGRFEHSFGYYVARIQLQKQPGHWSAFWMMCNGVGKVGDEGRDGTEIEVSLSAGARQPGTMGGDGEERHSSKRSMASSTVAAISKNLLCRVISSTVVMTGGQQASMTRLPYLLAWTTRETSAPIPFEVTNLAGERSRTALVPRWVSSGYRCSLKSGSAV